jgi:putative transposase
MRTFLNEHRSRSRVLVRDRSAVYHVISRTTCRAFLFGPNEKEMFCRLLLQQVRFAGLELLSYCVMSNHVHLLLRVPLVESISDSELLRRYADYYGSAKLPRSTFSLEELQGILAEGGSAAERARERIHARMYNLPAFMRELKQRFSIWYNHAHNNQGTIWAARYKSLIVEDEAETLTRVAAYIDLNPVRAELVEDPQDYRWCGYAAALAGNKVAQEGITGIFDSQRDYEQAMRSYRMILFGKGYATKQDGSNPRGTVSAERLEEIIRLDGKVPIQELLRVRVRYFADGLALGSKAFVEDIVRQNAGAFGAKRSRAGSALPRNAWGQLHVVRNLKTRVYG